MPQVALALNLTTTKGYPTFREAVGWYGIKCIWFDAQSTKNQQLPSMTMSALESTRFDCVTRQKQKIYTYKLCCKWNKYIYGNFGTPFFLVEEMGVIRRGSL